MHEVCWLKIISFNDFHCLQETRFVKQLCGWEKVEQSPDEVVSKLFQQIEHFFSQDSIGQGRQLLLNV